MVTVDEIRARVQAADEARIAVRAERAAEVAGMHNKLAELRAALAAGEAAFKGSAVSALEVMSADELADFAGVPKGAVQALVVPKPARVKAGSTRSRKKAQPRQETEPTSSAVTAGDGVTAAE